MPRRILVYVEPCIFRDDPGFLRGHFDCFVEPVLHALSLESGLSFLGIASNIFLSLAGLDCARALLHAPAETRIYPLYNSALLAGFGHSIEDYARDVFSVGNEPLNPALAKCLRDVIDSAQPDLVVTTSQNRYLTMLSRAVGFPLMSLEFGPLPRLTFPSNRFIALDGHLSAGAFRSPTNLLEAIQGIDDRDAINTIISFEADYLDAVSRHERCGQVREQLESIASTSTSTSRRTVSMLALQPEQWLTWEGVLGKRRSPHSVILEALDHLTTDKLIVTFHEDKRGHLNPQTLREIWLSDPRLELLTDELAVGLSELFLPFVDELITVSSNLAMSAFLMGKPIKTMGQSYARTLQRLAPRGDEGNGQALRGKVLRYLMDNMSVDDASFRTPRLLCQRLNRILDAHYLLQSTPQYVGGGSIEVAPGPIHDLRRSDLETIHGHLAADHASGSTSDRLLQTFGRHALGYLVNEGAIGAEFGVAKGFFSESLLRCRRFSKLYSVDKWSDHHDSEEYRFVQGRLAPFGSVSEIIKESFDDALNSMPECSLDFIYVDGYAHTGHDAYVIQRCLPKLKRGAMVAVHDFDSFSWPINYKNLSALLFSEQFTEQKPIPSILTLNDEDIFPGLVAKYVGRPR